MPKVGLALGGGGARGLAHILLLEQLDDFGVKVDRIAGTSIGAVVGAMYASGKSGSEIREVIEELTMQQADSLKKLWKKRKESFKWVKFFDLNLRGGGILRGDKFIDFLGEEIHASSFDELEIPLKVVATDFYTSEQVVLEEGDLLSAVKASMGLPGVFTPVQRDGHVLMDGGGVNPLPHDLLDDCDVTIAFDVMGYHDGDPDEPPNVFEAVLETFKIMQRSIIAAKRELSPPTIYVKPDISGVDLLEFHKIDKIFEQAGPAVKNLREQLEEHLG